MRFKGKVFDRLSAWNSGNIKDTIVVVGAPRSGTTWLAELLRELPGYKLVNEPLRLSTQPAARAAGFDWRTHVAPHEKRPEMSRYLSDVLRGDVELGPAWHFRSENTFAKLWEHTTHDRVIVKFCRAGRMLHWMTQQFDTRGIVVIIRHPCAVIASMLNMRDNWKPRDIQKKAVLKRLKGLISDSLIDELTSIPGATDTWVGHLAIQWSLDYYFALHGHAVESNDYPWTLTSYERLFIEKRNELGRIISGLHGTMTSDIASKIGKPSAFAANNFSFDREHQLNKWKKELASE